MTLRGRQEKSLAQSKLLHKTHNTITNCERPSNQMNVSSRREQSGRAAYNSRRPSIAFSMVISSVYSMSLPTGMPIAMRVTFTPARFSCCER
jgi:hypothetical protein